MLLRSLILCSLLLSTCDLAIAQTKAQKSPTRALTPAEKTTIAEAVRLELNDPESARFRWVPFLTDGSGYCGFVNARNAFGGYPGFVPYFVILFPEKAGSVTPSKPMIADASNGVMREVVVKMCTGSGYSPYP